MFLQGFELRSPAQQSTVLSSILDSAIILCNTCLQSLEVGQNKTKKTRFERDLFLICSLWHYIILFF